MAHVIAVVAAIGFVDSLNPSTIGPGLVLAATDPSGARVRKFTLGVFVVFTAAGVLLVLGPGQLLLAAVPRPGPTAKHVVELVAGAVLIAAAVVLSIRRRRLADRELPRGENGKGAFALGATISAVELPSAFPYFAAIAAIVDSDAGIVKQMVYLLIFNVVFVLPLLLIAAAPTIAGERAEPMLERLREWFEDHWPVLAAVILGTAGVLLVGFGAVGLATD
jgi:cytochrome c biogenesis protein CcdA